MNDRLIDAKELSSRLNVPLTWVWKAARERRIPAYKAGKYWRFDVDDVLASLANKQCDHEGEVVEIDFQRSSRLVNPRRDIAIQK